MIFGTFGIHPHETNTDQISKEEIISKIKSNSKIIGVGETGLDFYYNNSDKDKQITSFKNHINAALELNFPLIVHSRNAEDETFELLNKYKNQNIKLFAKSIILACGSFESNSEMRAKYLGENWRNIKLRGVPHNTGEGLEMAINHGAVPYDDWSTCHASPQDYNRPNFDLPGDNKSGDYWSRYAYPFSILVNQEGSRFVDEGETWRGLTYAKTGKAILEQKNQVAYQSVSYTHLTLPTKRIV